MSSLRLLDILRDPGVDAALEFVERAFGPLTPSDGIPAEVLQGLEMPEVLRRFELRVGRMPLHTQNHFVTPERSDILVEFRMTQRLDGKLVLYIENQGSWVWATAGEGEDPPVWVKGEELDGWELASPRLSRFLLESVLFEFPMSAPIKAWRYEPLPAEERDALLKSFVEVGAFGPAPYRFRFFATDDLVATDDRLGYVFVGARESVELLALGVNGPDWDFEGLTE